MNNTKFNEFLERLPRLSYRTMNNFNEALLNVSSEEVIQKSDFRKLALLSAISCNNTFTSCTYKEDDIDCCEYFQPMFSENGFCYVFNGKYKDTFDKEEPIKEQYSLLETDKKWGLKFVPAVLSEIYLVLALTSQRKTVTNFFLFSTHTKNVLDMISNRMLCGSPILQWSS